MSYTKFSAVAFAALILSGSAAFAQAGGPDLPGGAKTTTAAGKSTTTPRSHMKMKMSHRGKMADHKMM